MTTSSKFERHSVEEFKTRVGAYFTKVNAENTRRKSERLFILPYTLPGLAEHLRVTTAFLVTYPEEGKYTDIIEYAKTKCENFILDAIFHKTIDKSLGKYLLETYHGHGLAQKDKEKERNKRKLRTISDILNDEEHE